VLDTGKETIYSDAKMKECSLAGGLYHMFPVDISYSNESYYIYCEIPKQRLFELNLDKNFKVIN
jgi:hypothetical protein